MSSLMLVRSVVSEELKHTYTDRISRYSTNKCVNMCAIKLALLYMQLKTTKFNFKYMIFLKHFG